MLAPFQVLAVTPAIERLAETYMRQLALPGKALRDAAHLAFACGYELEYLVTWNCTPIVCTPEELMGTEEI